LVDLDDLLLQAQLVALQHTLRKPVELHKLNVGNDDLYKLGIRPMMPCLRVAMCYKLCTMPMKPILAVLTRSLLAHRYDLFLEAYKGDCAELFPEKVVDHDHEQSHILPVTRAIPKHVTSGESITTDIEAFACVSHVQSFGKHMPVDPTGV